jgi:hypothetical protein
VGAEATIGQSAYAEFLINAPDPNDLNKMTRNKEFYNMLVKATNQGYATHLLSENKDDGHATWVAIRNWYNGESTSRRIIEHFRTKLSKLELDENTSASSFINDFIICHKRLDAKSEGVTAASKRESFLDKIVDSDYAITKEFLTLHQQLGFDECVVNIRRRETYLKLQDNKDSTTRARRATENYDSDEVSNKRARRFKGNNYESKKDGPRIPSIPNAILYKIQPEHVRKNLIRWRGIYNSEGRQIKPDELQTQDDSTPTPPKKSRQRGGSSNGSNKIHDTNPKAGLHVGYSGTQNNQASQFGASQSEPKSCGTQDSGRQETSYNDSSLRQGSSRILVLLFILHRRLFQPYRSQRARLANSDGKTSWSHARRIFRCFDSHSGSQSGTTNQQLNSRSPTFFLEDSLVSLGIMATR